MDIAVCDDDAKELEALHEVIDTWADEQGRTVKVHPFLQGEALCGMILDGGRYDLFILDILMPEMDGISLAKRLRASGHVADGTPIIFLTSSRDYAVESYEVRAFHYLLKPLQPDKIKQVLDAAFDSVQKEVNDAVFVRTKDGEYYVNRAEICYMMYEDRAVIYACTGKTLKSLSIQGSFKNATAGFDTDSRFFRCGASVVVNLSVIRSIDKNTVVFVNNMEITVPRTSSKVLYRAWLDYYLD